jgi:hypothetical protein
MRQIVDSDSVRMRKIVDIKSDDESDIKDDESDNMDDESDNKDDESDNKDDESEELGIALERVGDKDNCTTILSFMCDSVGYKYWSSNRKTRAYFGSVEEKIYQLLVELFERRLDQNDKSVQFEHYMKILTEVQAIGVLLRLSVYNTRLDYGLKSAVKAISMSKLGEVGSSLINTLENLKFATKERERLGISFKETKDLLKEWNSIMSEDKKKIVKQRDLFMGTIKSLLVQTNDDDLDRIVEFVYPSEPVQSCCPS